MLTPIKEKKLAGFQEFEEWLDKEQLLNSDVLYRGHADSTWGLESTLYRHQLARFHDRHPSLDVPISKYTDVAKKLQAIVETHTDQHFDDNPRECDRFPNTTEQLSFRYAVYLRHRGFPSPLLDWSLSPYVAAYFAFIDVANRTETKNGNEDDDSRVALFVMRPPTYPVKNQVGWAEDLSIRYWPTPVKGETRHYDQQSAYTIALRHSRYNPEKTSVYCYSSHEYILRNFPQGVAPDTDRVTHANAKGDAICWKITIPQRDRDSVLRRLDRMNINAYTLFRTEDALVGTYGLRELRRMRNTS